MAYSSSSSTGHGIDTTADKAAKFVRSMAGLVGAVFLLVGILGFIPGITSNYDTLSFAGNNSDAKLLGLFEVSILHNIVHLLFGVAGLAMAKATKSATSYLIGGGIIYLVLTVYGFVIDQNSSANFVPVNNADNVLHLLLGIGMIALGLPGRRAVDANGARTVA
jgi:hypothetical protein